MNPKWICGMGLLVIACMRAGGLIRAAHDHKAHWTRHGGIALALLIDVALLYGAGALPGQAVTP